MYKPSVVFRFVDYLFCFRPPNRLFFRLKTISVVSSICHSDVVGAHKNDLSKAILMSTYNIDFYEAILMSTHNICFYEETSKINL